MSLKEVQEEIIEEFAVFDEWLDKYEYLIELGNALEPINESFRTPEYLINGCQSKVWINAELNDGKVIFEADSDAIITKGIVALLIRVLSDRKPEEIMNADLFFIDSIGLTQNLSPTRSNGLLAMVKQMKMYGMAYHAKQNRT
ncbi:MAG: SufE family protein [Chloroflexia bacterium]|nr:SufE family protein [Chloroflexia bacterium]